MLKLSIYDFDKTIYKNDSMVDFWIFMIKRRPYILVFFPLQAFLAVLFVLRIIPAGVIKRWFLLYLRGIKMEKIDSYVAEFWRKKKPLIFDWALNNIQNEREKGLTIVCISASPRFLLQPIINELGIKHLICTELLEKNGKFNNKIVGKNCRDKEKVIKLNDWAKNNGFDYSVEIFYSDSMSDRPMFDISTEKYFVEKGKVSAIK